MFKYVNLKYSNIIILNVSNMFNCFCGRVDNRMTNYDQICNIFKYTHIQ